jgi:type III pantothenate kinase
MTSALMLLVIDIGNTRTKWALADDKGQLSTIGVCLNAELAKANLPIKQAQKAVIANVAGAQIAQQITQLLAPLETHFVKVTAEACGLKNNYEATLGVDRWAALVAAWHMNKQVGVVVNAGTAITIDALTERGEFLGGSIMPGLHLMRASLSKNAALLNVEEGVLTEFPTNTTDAIQTGCLNAIVGAINLMLKRLEKQCGRAPLLVLSGGDAQVIAKALSMQILNLDTKQVIITENLVLQGLALLAKA